MKLAEHRGAVVESPGAGGGEGLMLLEKYG
jgi:hypothetical protein